MFQTVQGDTVVTTSTGVPPRVRADSIEILWQNPDLDRPGNMALVGDRLVVIDRQRLHIINLSTRSVRTVGRNGEGPGEFRIPMLVAAFPGDSIAIYDPRLLRVSVLDSRGDFGRQVRLTPPFPYVEIRRWSNVLRPWDGGVLMLMSTSMDSRQEVSTRAALAWIDPSVDTASILGAWDDLHYMAVGQRGLASRRLFPARLAIAVSERGQIAHGDGMTYCIEVASVSASAEPVNGVRRVCRTTDPVPVGAGIRRYGFEDIPASDEERRLLRNVLREQRIPDHIPYFDELQYDVSGRLWVRTLGPEFSDLHPLRLAWFPEQGPPFRCWEVFDKDLRLVAAVEIPRAFQPLAFGFDRLFGVTELESGEIAVSMVRLPQRLARSMAPSPPRGDSDGV